MSIISLLSDFGNKDPYVAEMKAVILSINPQVRIIDITIHVAVVDPGVGTKRRPIIAETSRSLYVGPDNGLLMLAAHKEHILNVYTIDNPEYMLSHVSKTFHGRDIFAPAAAHLRGNKPSDFGSAIHDYVFPEFAKPHARNGELQGEILHIDDFGNIISNITLENLKKIGLREGNSILVRLGNKTLTIQFCSAYGEVPAGTPLALIGSSNFLEVAVNQRSASAIFKAKVGEAFHVSVAVSS